jgi:DNA-binding CsgD family transcriptional regulator
MDPKKLPCRLRPAEYEALGMRVPKAECPGRPAKKGFLTAKQGRVAAYMLLNCSDLTISKEMGVQIGSTRQHICSIYRKFAVHNRADAVKLLEAKYQTPSNLLRQVTQDNKEDQL